MAGEFIYHLALLREWDAAGSHYDRSTIGMTIEEVGFMHASTSEQLAGTAQLFYADCGEELVVLVIDPSILAAMGIDLRYEPIPTGQLFPHVYGALPRAAVVNVVPAGFDERGAFELRA